MFKGKTKEEVDTSIQQYYDEELAKSNIRLSFASQAKQLELDRE